MSTFEATIRVLGGLLSAHYLVTEPVLRPAILRAAANSTLGRLAGRHATAVG